MDWMNSSAKPDPKQTEEPFQSNGARTVDFQKHIRPILEESLEESGAAQLRVDQALSVQMVGTLCPDKLEASADNFDVLIERIPESEEAVGGKSFKPSAEQRGHPGLVSAEQVRRRLLRQFANPLTPGCAFGSRWAYVVLELPRLCASSAR